MSVLGQKFDNQELRGLQPGKVSPYRTLLSDTIMREDSNVIIYVVFNKVSPGI